MRNRYSHAVKSGGSSSNPSYELQGFFSGFLKFSAQINDLTSLKLSLIVGVIWGLWHLPLWFVSGFQGVNLLLYVVFFMVGLVSFSVIIGYDTVEAGIWFTRYCCTRCSTSLADC
jgi:hypothetical protein